MANDYDMPPVQTDDNLKRTMNTPWASRGYGYPAVASPLPQKSADADYPTVAVAPPMTAPEPPPDSSGMPPVNTTPQKPQPPNYMPPVETGWKKAEELGLGTIGNALLPGMGNKIAAAIPGTRAAYNQGFADQLQNYDVQNKDYLERAKESQEAQTGKSTQNLQGAQANEANAKAEAAKNPPPKMQRAVIAGADGNPKAVDFNPATGAYIDPDSGKPIPGAKLWEKPQMPKETTIEQQMGAAVADAVARGADPQKDPKVQQLVGTYRLLHPEQPNFASIYPQIRGADAMEKPTTDYTNFVSQSGAVKEDISKARDGNELANSIAPLGTALLVTGAGGVHRINMTEIQRAGDPQMGSLARRIDAALEKAGTGKLPADTLEEMQQLVDMYGSYKYKAYLQQARVTSANFKMGDVDVLSPDGEDFIPLSKAMEQIGFRGKGVAPGGGSNIPSFKQWKQDQSKGANAR